MAESQPFLGMVMPGQHLANQEKDSYKDKVVFLDPNGTAPMFAMSVKSSKGMPLSSTSHDYYTNTSPERGGAFTALYVDNLLSDAYVSADDGNTGTSVFIKMGATRASHVACASEFRKNNTIMLSYSEDPDVAVNATVIDVVVAGSDSYVEVKLLEDDDNSSNGFNLEDSDYVYTVGDAHPAGGYTPTAINYVDTLMTQHTQIFKEAIELSRTYMDEALKTDPNREAIIKRERQEKLLCFSRYIELAGFMSKYGSHSDSLGKTVWEMMGLLEFIRTYSSSNIIDFRYDASFSGDEWEESGEEWMSDNLISTFMYQIRGRSTPQERIGWCSTYGVNAINKLIKANGLPELTISQKAWGFQVYEWRTVNGTIYLHVHPLFNQIPLLWYTMVVSHPKFMEWHPLRNADIKRTDVTPAGFDGTMEQYMTECLFMFMHSPLMMVLSGIGKDNVV